MSLGHAPFHSVLCAAALLALGFAATPACAVGDPSPTPPAPSAGAKPGRGLILTVPAARPADTQHRGGTRPSAFDDPSPEKRPPLRSFLEIDAGSAGFAPVAGIVYVF